MPDARESLNTISLKPVLRFLAKQMPSARPESKGLMILEKFLTWWKRCLSNPTPSELSVRNDTYEWMLGGDWEPKDIINKIRTDGLPVDHLGAWLTLFHRWKKETFGHHGTYPRRIMYPISFDKCLRKAVPRAKREYRRQLHKFIVRERLLGQKIDSDESAIEAEIQKDLVRVVNSRTEHDHITAEINHCHSVLKKLNQKQRARAGGLAASEGFHAGKKRKKSNQNTSAV